MKLAQLKLRVNTATHVAGQASASVMNSALLKLGLVFRHKTFQTPTVGINDATVRAGANGTVRVVACSDRQP